MFYFFKNFRGESVTHCKAPETLYVIERQMELVSFYSILGFILACYSVIANDSVQTLGTFIASNSRTFKWYILATCASLVLCFTLWYGWLVNGGDISYGRLNKIPFQDCHLYTSPSPRDRQKSRMPSSA